MADPNKLFPVITISREQIADSLNDALEVADVTDVEPFAPDDDRLTDEFCRLVADKLYDVELASSNEDLYDDLARDAMLDSLEDFDVVSKLDGLSKRRK